MRPSSTLDSYLVILGNPVDGFRHIGPFESPHDANEFADSEYRSEQWHVATLARPSSVARYIVTPMHSCPNSDGNVCATLDEALAWAVAYSAQHEGAESESTLEAVLCHHNGAAWVLVNDNGWQWEPCSEGPY